MTQNDNHPNCSKLAGLTKERDIILEFLDYLREEREVFLGRYVVQNSGTPYERDSFETFMYPLERLVLEFLGVDPDALEDERRKILEDWRARA